MRKDINFTLEDLFLEGMKPNYSEMARRFNVDRRTAKRHYEAFVRGEDLSTRKMRMTVSVLDGFKETIEAKVKSNNKAKSIFRFIKQRGYTGSYTTLQRYVQKVKKEEVRKATIRFESSPGLSAQVDWKEDMTLYNRRGEKFEFSIFLFVLGYSRYKYIELVSDRKQETLFGALTRSFDDIGGMPHEIWFDNMKQVVDHQKSDFHGVVLNERFKQYAMDAGFKPIVARPFRPQTKGKVEALARLMEQLYVYDGEFDTWEDLGEIVSVFGIEINLEKSQGSGRVPFDDLDNTEKGYLRLTDTQLLQTYSTHKLWRVVSKESMVNYDNRKYSVPLEYIGKRLEVKADDQYLRIYDGYDLVRMHHISNRPFNYTEMDAFNILKSDVFKHRDDDYIMEYMKNNLDIYDNI
jgi:transposase